MGHIATQHLPFGSQWPARNQLSVTRGNYWLYIFYLAQPSSSDNGWVGGSK